MRMEIPHKSWHKTSQMRWHDAQKNKVIFQRSQAALRKIPLPSKPRRLYCKGCSVWSAHGAQRKVTVGYPQVSVKRCQWDSRNSQISKNPPFCPNVPLMLVLPRFEIQHDAVVNHGCMSKQLCQAESECPLLVRLRPKSSSKGASWVTCYGVCFFLFFKGRSI